ncbi:hypothetical protein BB559_007191 [Furculomyces boomerangus]|uniref:MMS19 C-terminal domain-containing protein n=1 Tax=Furculomyces boomerangus TaxID=61424 RepID=A0A2T9XYH0_9FUNG|nr:hypothetical protein BB559_007191 [Furculomyces boomerangus]
MDHSFAVNKKCNSTVSPLYKQRYFMHLVPAITLNYQTLGIEIRNNLLVSFIGVINDVPSTVLASGIQKISPLLYDATTYPNAGLRETAIKSLYKILEKSPEIIKSSFNPRDLVMMMLKCLGNDGNSPVKVRISALEFICLVADKFEFLTLSQIRKEVIKQLTKSLDDGRCSFGSRCKNEHPQTEKFGQSGFGSSGFDTGFNRSNRSVFGLGQAKAPGITEGSIISDLEEFPSWRFSSYGPSGEFESIIIGTDVSFEELRLNYYMCSQMNNMQAYQQFVSQSEEKINKEIQRVLTNPKEALNAAKDPNSRTGFQGGFGTAFGTSAVPTVPTAFGGDSQGGFGTPTKPAFGAPPAFGSPSTFGALMTPAAPTSFGAPTAFGTSAAPTAFGTSAGSIVFGKSAASTAFGTSAAPTAFGPQGNVSSGGGINFGSVLENKNQQSAFGESSAHAQNVSGFSGFGGTQNNAGFGATSNSVFGSGASQFGQAGFSSGSVFGKESPGSGGKKLFGSTQGEIVASICGPEGNISEENIAKFKNSKFDLFEVPEIPPPFDLCQ